MEPGEEDRKVGNERRKSSDLKRAKKVARLETNEENQVIGSERGRSRDQRRTEKIGRLETNGEDRKVDDHWNVTLPEGRPA